MGLQTGNQLRAARALVDMGQGDLSKLADVNINTIRNMEAKGAEILSSGLATISKVQSALEATGVEFIPENGGGAGVRLKKVGAQK